MNEIFDLDKLPDRRLGVRKMVCLHQHIDIGEAVTIVKREMAMELATKIMGDKSFFFERASKVAHYAALEYGADCIVLTREEYVDLRRQCFKEGVQHATGFMGGSAF